MHSLRTDRYFLIKLAVCVKPVYAESGLDASLDNAGAMQPDSHDATT